MKKSIKTIIGLGLALGLSVASLAGCNNNGGSAPVSSSAPQVKTVKANDYVSAVFKGILTGDASEAKLCGLDDASATQLEEANKQLDKVKDGVIAGVGSKYKEYIEAEPLEKFATGFKTAVAKLPFTVETLSDSGDEAEVAVKVKPISIKDYATDAAQEALATVDQSKMNDPSVLKSYFSTYFNTLAQKLEANAKPGAEKTVKIKLKKTGDTWEFTTPSSAMRSLANSIVTA
ncbi:MAG: DUF5105 domain-containing protein [Lachnospiraceae bacterium]|nr:DUF5105 domain-containing protein [Lachnospiraceae bacterium]